VVLKEGETFDETDDGPLTVSSDGGSTALALFRAPEGAGRLARRQTVAFRVGGAGFLEFLHRLESLEVAGADGRRLGPGDVVDHDHCFSVYFKDPDGNPYELTTYDYDLVRRWLGASTGG
jgi:catechol 2,3-dioxygenase-like lactoylglutathione lyase family enzyme